MSGRLVYLDSSAIVKLVVREAESGALWTFLRQWSEQASSVLARVEVLRALTGSGASPAIMQRGRQVLDRLTLIRLDNAIAEEAVSCRPATLRTLDAIHLAAARSVQNDLQAFITYDLRMAEAAQLVQLPVIAPGARIP